MVGTMQMMMRAVLLMAVIALSLSGRAFAQETSAADAATTGSQTSALPILVTDVGQGNNAKLIAAMLKRLNLSQDAITTNELAKAGDLGNAKTLIVGVGASTKGLGAAGLNTAQEAERATQLLAAAREKKLRIVGVHLGGEARRGELSDTFNKQVLDASEEFIVWSGGNADGFFTKNAGAKVKLITVEKKTDVGTKLQEILGLK